MTTTRTEVKALAHAANEWLKADKAAAALDMDEDMVETVMAKHDERLEAAAIQVIEELQA